MTNNRNFAVAYVSIIAVASIASLYASSLNRTFIVTWSKGEQEIVDGTLRIKISFQWTNESLSVIAKINHRQDFGHYLGLVFDKNGNGKIDYWGSDEPYLLGRKNWTCYHSSLCPPPSTPKSAYYWGEGPHLIPCRCASDSPYHTCVFQENVGYTYNISIPKSELSKVKANVVHIYYWSQAARDYGSAWEKCWVWARAKGIRVGLITFWNEIAQKGGET